MKIYAAALLLLSQNALALDVEQLKALHEAVREMCLHPDRAGAIIRVEGDVKAGLPVPVKLVKADLSGSISFEAWKGIPITLDKYKTDPRECSIELVKILTPSFEKSNTDKPPAIKPSLQKSSSLYFNNEGGPLFNPNIQVATWMRAETVQGSGCSSNSRSSTKILWSPATFGMSPQSNTAAFSYELGQAYDWAGTIAESLSKMLAVPRSCVSASFENFIRLSFDDSRGSSVVRNYRIKVSSDRLPLEGDITLTVPLLFDEANQALESAKAQNMIVTLPLAMEGLLREFK